MAFASNRDGAHAIYVRDASAAAPERLLLNRENAVAPVDWSSDNRYLIFRESAASAWDLWILPLEGDRAPIPYLRNGSTNMSARLSLDGRWLAYVSRDAAATSLFVQGFPKPGRRWLVDTGNHISSVLGWSGKGDEVLWTPVGGRTVSAATVRASEKDEQATVAIGAPRVVHRMGPSTNGNDTLIGRGANG